MGVCASFEGTDGNNSPQQRRRQGHPCTESTSTAECDFSGDTTPCRTTRVTLHAECESVREAQESREE